MNYCPLAQHKICFLVDFNNIVKDGAPLDVKDKINKELGKSIKLGGLWFEWSTSGNIIYGFYGTAWGFTPTELHAGAGFAQIMDYLKDESGEVEVGRSYYGDTAGDYYAVEFGIYLYEQGYAPDNVVTVQEFTALLTDYTSLSRMDIENPPPFFSGSNPNWPYHQGYFYNDIAVPQPASLYPTFQ